MKPKNTVRLTKSDKSGEHYDVWFYTDAGRVKIRRSTTTILKALQHYDKCPFKDDVKHYT